MAKNKLMLEFNFGKMYKMFEEIGENAEDAVKRAIEEPAKIIQKELDLFFDAHTMTGQADDSLKKNPKVEKKGTRYEMALGFDLNKPHGYLAILFEKGTPKNNPPEYKFINTAFRNPEVRKKMRAILKEYLEGSVEKATKGSDKSGK